MRTLGSDVCLSDGVGVLKVSIRWTDTQVVGSLKTSDDC